MARVKDSTGRCISVTESMHLPDASTIEEVLSKPQRQRIRSNLLFLAARKTDSFPKGDAKRNGARTLERASERQNYIYIMWDSFSSTVLRKRDRNPAEASLLIVGAAQAQ